MKKLLKLIAAAAVLALLLAVAATVFIKVKYPPEKIKALVVEQAEKRLGRALRLGKVDIGLVRGLSLEDVELSESPNFAAGTFLSAKRVAVAPFLLPLLKGRVAVKSVSLDKPAVAVVRFPDGRFNFSSLSGPPPAGAPAAAPGGGAPAIPLTINAVSIEGGSFSFDDRAGGLKASLKDLSLHAAAFSLTAPFAATLSCKFQAAPAGKTAVAGAVAFKGRVNPAGAGAADVARLALSLDGGASLEGKGTVRNFSAPEADMAFELKEFRAQALAPFAPLPPALRDASLHGTFQVKGGLAGAVVKGSFKGTAAGAAADIALDASVKDPAGAPSFAAALSLSDLALDKSPLLPAGVKVRGPLSLSLSAKGTPDRLEFSADLQGKDAALSYGDLFAKPAGTALSMSAKGSVTAQKDVSLASARLTLGAALVEARGTVADAPGAGRLDLHITAPPFDVAPVGAMLPPAAAYKLTGRAGADLAVKGTARSPQAAGTLQFAGLGAVPMEGVRLAGLAGTASFTQDSLDLPALKGKLNGEDLSLKAKVLGFARPDVRVDGALASLDLGKLQAAFASTAPAAGASPAPAAPPSGAAPPVARAKGSFRIARLTHPHYLGKDFSLAWDLTDLGPDLARLNGTARLAAADGSIRNIPLADKINKLLKRDGAEIGYSKLGGSFAINRGVMDTQDFKLDSDQLSVAAKGTVNLATTVADLRAVFKLPKGSIGGSTGEIFEGDDGRPTIETTITGLITNPTIRPDLTKAAARAAKSYFKKLVGGAASPAGGGSSPDAGAAEDPKKKIADEAQKALRNLFKKKSQ